MTSHWMSAPLRTALPRPPNKSPNRPLAEKVAEGLEDVAHVAEMRGVARLQPREAKAVELRLLVRVIEHLKRLGGLLEVGHCLLVARIAVGMVFQRQLAVGLGDLLLACGTLDPKDLVIVAFFGHHHHILPYVTRTS